MLNVDFFLSESKEQRNSLETMFYKHDLIVMFYETNVVDFIIEYVPKSSTVTYYKPFDCIHTMY